MKSYKATYLDMNTRERSQRILRAGDMDAARQDAAALGKVLRVKKVGHAQMGTRMSIGDRLVFMQRLASMLSARVGASEALKIIQESFTGLSREAASIMADEISRHGANLPDAMQAAGPRFFPDTVVAIVRTGSHGGDIAYAMREAVRFERELAKVRKESGRGLISALGSFAIGIITVLASTLYVTPLIMKSGFMTMGDAPPKSLGWILMMNDSLTYVAGFVGAAALLFALVRLVFHPVAPVAIDRLILKIPYYRDIVLAKSHYVVFFGLAVLLKAGLRVERAFALAIDSAPKGELRNDLQRAQKAIVEGSSRPWPYAMTTLHATDKAALATAMNKEQIAQTIEDLSLQYGDLYRARLDTIVPTLQVFAALFLSVAGFILFAVSTIPLFEVSSKILGAL